MDQTRPRTLLEMAGAPQTPSPLDASTLVVIDAQREYRDGGVKLAGIDNAVGELARLLKLARDAKVPVIHIVHHGRSGGALFDPDGPYSKIIPEVEPVAGEQVIAKALPNAFTKTGLQEALQAAGRKELILAGFMTHMCVSATARSALDHGWRTTVVAKAAATRDLPDPMGGVMAADAVHRAALTELADRFAIIVPDASAWR
jgi:nicotinamidase-related amidase